MSDTMVELASEESITKFVEYAEIREGKKVALRVKSTLLALREQGLAKVDGFKVLEPIIEQLKPGLDEAWELTGMKRVVASLRPQPSEREQSH